MIKVLKNIGIASGLVIGGTLLGSQFMPPGNSFADAKSPLLQKYAEGGNWLDKDKAYKLVSQEFDVNRDGIIFGDEEDKAIDFVAELYTDKLGSLFSVPLNMTEARLNVLDALYKMSTNPNEVHSKINEKIAALSR